ncbi:blastoderm-specific protein 25D isoform X2 [Toxorhynchites rutilus septentrionalis]|uniref:blastoderm-specific protein 25D isoform X2 n=1 Tax=Toxorhynchites rutilus septentrionalis TaxID=329112 RepID=UPI002479E009|nr:blastoderm-specific protein 25D isoform X2 [Toxorhynchites rutilus septentrionalis]
MALSPDPYEQRLYHMFQAHDVDSCGRLDRDALLKLCVTLELKERGQSLVKCLLSEDNRRVTFKEFREGLLQILGGEEDPEEQRQERCKQQIPAQQGSADDQNASTGSPTATAPSITTTGSNSHKAPTATGSIIFNSPKHHHHPHLICHRQLTDRKSEVESESTVKITISGGSSTVPSGEDDLVTSTATTTPTNLITTTTATTTSDNENDSSDREVSPKFVVGTKKYGRRSRPREDCNGFETSSDFSNSDNESVPQPVIGQRQQHQQMVQSPPPSDAVSKISSKVHRSASQSDIHGSKRRRPISGSRLKRCASLPTHRQRPEHISSKLNARNVSAQLNMDEKIDKKIYFMRLSENLRDIWNSLVVSGHGDMLNQSQLEVVCERVGLQKLPAKLAAHEVFAKLSLQPIEGIGFDEFISLLQSDSDILQIGDGGGGGTDGGGGGGGGVSVGVNGRETTNSERGGGGGAGVVVRLFDESNNFKAQELDRESVKETVDLTMHTLDWTAEFGSLSTAIIIDMWESAGIGEPRKLLQELGFYGEEIQVTELVGALEEELQRLGGNSDTSAIVRASLALHKAEVSALRQAFVQLVEENKKLYSDNKEVNHRALLLAQEVDERHNSLENTTRTKIRHLEQRHHETIKEITSQLASEREQLSCANVALEKRIQTLESDEGKMKLEMSRLSEENEGLRMEQETLTRELTDLLEKNIKLNKDIAELEENNRNDFDYVFSRKEEDPEILKLIEKMSLLQDENTDLRDKNDELIAEVESLNVELAKFKLKRSSINRTSSVEVSPVVVETTAGAGEENASAARKRQGDSPSKVRLSDESPRLGKFRKCSSDLENESDSSGDWMALHSELGIRMGSAVTSSGISQDFSSINDSNISREDENRQLKAKIAELEKKLEGMKASSDGKTESVGEEGDGSEGEKLKARCEELEASLEQMSKEYEACEDYWQEKVNEERQLFEEEQRVSDERFNELLKKMAEYEEQFSGQPAGSKSDDGRLSPIEEKDILEQQYLDLEAELQQSQLMLEQKTIEVEKLTSRVLELEEMNKYRSEVTLATPPPLETPDMESPACSPISYLWNQSTIQAPATRDYHNPNWSHPVKGSSPSGETTARDDDGKLNCSSQSKQSDDLAPDGDSGFNPTVSPIQKPSTSVAHTTSDDNHELGDCSDVCSVKSAKSTHSLASTHSIHKSVSQTDVAMISQEQLKQARLIQLQLEDEIKELTHKRDCLKMEFQQLNEVKPILERAYTKTTHPNVNQKIQHLEQKNRHLQMMLRQQQTYSEEIFHRVWQQQCSDINELRQRVEAQNMHLTEQASKLMKNDMLVKDLYMENSRLVAQIQRLEQQKARATLLQQFSQAAANSHHSSHHQSHLSGIVPGLP